jgi:hypothetical protein
LVNYTAFLFFVQVIHFNVKKNIVLREISLGRVRLDMQPREDEVNPLILGHIDFVFEDDVQHLSGFHGRFALELPKDAKQSELNFSNTKVCYEYCSCVTASSSMIQNHPMGSRTFYNY